jgi:hypothetical protein
MTAPPPSPWRADLARRRALPCPACGHTGPHAARCTPWYQTHWGDVRCAECDRFLEFIPAPPAADRGAATLYARAQSQVDAMDRLEAFLDNRGLRWITPSLPPSPRTLIDHHGAPPTLTTDEARILAILLTDLRAAFSWPPDEWRWTEAKHTHRREQAYTNPNQIALI